MSLRDRDYLDGSDRPIREKLLDFVHAHMPAEQIHRVIMVTACRYLGYVFNPVSLYYCYDAQDRLLGNVAEVNNTFGERHVYVLAASNGGRTATLSAMKPTRPFMSRPSIGWRAAIISALPTSGGSWI